MKEDGGSSDGKIDAEGSYAELMANGALQQLLEECEDERNNQTEKKESEEDGEGLER